MRANRRLRWVRIPLAIILLIATLGWISNSISKTACLKQVGSWLCNQPIGGGFFYLLDPDNDIDVRATLDSMGAVYDVIGSKSQGARTWPRISLKTHSLIPFLISVDYFWEREALIGGGATKWYICFF